jgi:two-component system sensor histidine kinase QseC
MRERLVVRSTNAPEASLASGDVPGLRTSMVEGDAWRVLTTPGREPDVVIHVGELESARHHILMASLRSIGLPMLLALPLLALGIWWAVRGAVRPLRALGQAVAARRPQALQPLSVHAVPREVAPLVTALNGLFERMTDLLESERRFTADAAHELRTPIAAIRMQVQVAQEAPSDAGREQALAATLQGCDRAARLVEQLLQLARLESEASYGEGPVRPGPSSADMAAIARALVARVRTTGDGAWPATGPGCRRRRAFSIAGGAGTGSDAQSDRQRRALQPRWCPGADFGRLLA